MDEDQKPTSGIRETSRALPIALLRARETVMAPIREMLNDIGLTEQKWRILRTLDESGRLEQTAIAEKACLLLPSVTRITKSMEDQGLLIRVSDIKDKRKMMVEITKKGAGIVRDNSAFSNQIYADLENKLGKEKMDRLLDLLEELKDMKIK